MYLQGCLLASFHERTQMRVPSSRRDNKSLRKQYQEIYWFPFYQVKEGVFADSCINNKHLETDWQKEICAAACRRRNGEETCFGRAPDG